MKKILFVCIHNSARSQMAEAFLNHYASGKAFAESAGLEAGTLNPIAVELMKETGIDISQNKTKSVFDFYKRGKTYDFVITVCDEGNSERCPIFPGNSQKLHWPIDDPSSISGNDAYVKERIRIIRDEIRDRVLALLKVI